MKKGVYAGLSLGLTLFVTLIVYQGVGEVARALAVAGWGLLLVALYHLLPMFINSLAWQCLLRPTAAPAFASLVRARWIGEAINALLPVAQIGGDVVKARLIVHPGLPGSLAGASVMVDLTLALFTQVVFTLAGLGILASLLGGGDVALFVLAGLTVSAACFAAFYYVQRLGLFSALTVALERLCALCNWQEWRQMLSGGAQALDQEINAMYGRRRSLIGAAKWRLVGWLLGVGEVWLALLFLGAPVDLWQALMLESLGQAVRAAAFIIPGAVGVQEAGFVLLGATLGLSPELALSLSLAKRVRELALGLPALLIWRWGGSRANPDRIPAGARQAGAPSAHSPPANRRWDRPHPPKNSR